MNLLDPVRAPRPEYIDRAGERISARALVHQRGQTLRALADVDRLPDYDVDRAGRADHAPPFSAPTTASIVARFAPFSTVTLTPPPSISIEAIRRLCARRLGRGERDGGLGSGAAPACCAITACTKAARLSRPPDGPRAAR